MSTYKEDLKIDKLLLDIEWEKQAQLFMKWAENCADAIYERDKLKQKLDIIKADIDSRIRKDPKLYGLDKITEAAVTNAIIQNEKYIKENEFLIKANYNVNILSGAREAMNHKKKALEMMTQLTISNYYADPKIPTEAKDISEEIGRKAIKRKLNRNKK